VKSAVDPYMLPTVPLLELLRLVSWRERAEDSSRFNLARVAEHARKYAVG
jgi:hypothetical protein